MLRAFCFYSLFIITHLALLPLVLFPFSVRLLLSVLGFYALGTAVMLFLLFHPRLQWLIRNRSSVDDGAVALTFDDGPDPVNTPKLLDLLREKQVKATFFVVGSHARKHPEIVRRAWDDGHLIATHTFSHFPLFCFLTRRQLRYEVEEGVRAVTEACGIRPRYFRSPVGIRHPLLAPLLQQSGLEYISWRVRSRDTITRAPKKLTRFILRKTKSGDIILLHDGLPGENPVTLMALPEIIDGLRRKGLDFVLVGPRGE